MGHFPPIAFIVALSVDGDVKLELWTDGSCYKDDSTDAIGDAGSGIVCVEADTNKILFLLGEYIGVESNNYAEYRAIEIGLEEIKRRYEVDESFEIEVVSDSKLAVNTLGGSWKTNKSHLREIIGRIQELEDELGVIIQYSWVKAHIGVHYNELADYLAYNAARGD
jgi:ribonuclease HI